MARTALLTVDGRAHQIALEPDRSLLMVLREDLGLTGPKYGCGEGVCGACTVLLDGAVARACVVPAAGVAGRSVTTAHGLARDGRLSAVQRAFVEDRALQCGYCTPGMVVAATALLEDTPHPDRRRIVQAMNGNLCRCGVYGRIVRAIGHASDLDDASSPTDRPPTDRPPTDAAVSRTSFDRPERPWDRTEPEDRDWFGLLQEGIVAVLPPEAVDHGVWTAGGGAWIHVGADGSITAFTGKVEIGQGNRAALTRIVAEELRVPGGEVRVVMGDTDVCPWDAGTFASRSIVDAGWNLAAAAAGLREDLLRRASERLEVDGADLDVGDGRVTVRGTERSIAYGRLADGRRDVVVVSGDVARTAPSRWTTAAHARPALDAVTGRRTFPSDVSRPRMLHGVMLRPPAHGAVLRSTDVTDAESMEGVLVVADRGLVGAVAPDPWTARRAVERIRAHWKRAAQPSDVEISRYLREHPAEGSGWGGAHHWERGDVDAALRAAVVRLERTYTAAYVAHAPLETRVAVAEWDERGVTIWTGTQRPFGAREQIATALSVPEDDVRVIAPTTGVGFGGKHSVEAAVEAARLARAAGRPVKVRWTSGEEFAHAYFRPAAVIDVRAGAAANGCLLAWDLLNVNSGAFGIGLPYDAPDVRTRYRPADSPLPQGSYRGLAATANAFARESMLDELAVELRRDPLEFRLANLSDGRLAAVLAAAAERAGWDGRPTVGRDGLGLALGIEKGGRVACVARVEVEHDWRVRVAQLVMAYDCGAVVDEENLRNQIEGAAVVALGGALFERVRFQDGRILNGSFRDYRVPRFSDVPDVDVMILDRRDEPSAGGGETPMIAVAPAIANAIVAATGRRVRSMPLAPDGYVS